MIDLIKKINSYYLSNLRSFEKIAQNIDLSIYNKAIQISNDLDPYLRDKIKELESYVPKTPEEKKAQQELIEKYLDNADNDAAKELRLVANIYRSALELNAGWNTVYTALNAFTNSVDFDDEDQQDAVDDIINQITIDIRNRAGGRAALNTPDSKEVKDKLEKAKNEFNESLIEEEIGYKQDVDLTGGAKFDDGGGQKGFGSGLSFGTRSTKEIFERYQREILKLEDDLKDEKDPSIVEKIKKIIAIDEKLVSLYKDNKEDFDLKSVVDLNQNPELKNKIERLEKIIDDFKKNRVTAKAALKLALNGKAAESLKSKLDSTTDYFEKIKLEQEIALKELTLSKFTNKGPERKARLNLLNQLGGKKDVFGKEIGRRTNLTPEKVNEILKDIERASSLKVPISESSKSYTESIMKEKDLGVDEFGNKIKRDPNKNRSLNKDFIDVEKIVDELNQSLVGLVRTFEHSRNSKINDIKKSILKSMDKETKDLTSDLLNELSNGWQNNQKQAVQHIRLEIKNIIVKQFEETKLYKDFVVFSRFRKIIQPYYLLCKKLVASFPKGTTQDLPLNGEQKALAEAIIDNGNNIIKRYANMMVGVNRYRDESDPLFGKGLKPSGYNNLVTYVIYINNKLKGML